jgi:hypothetical protein
VVEYGSVLRYVSDDRFNTLPSPIVVAHINPRVSLLHAPDR